MKMRMALTVALLAVLSASLLAQAPQEKGSGKRYGIELHLKKFPQTTPKETLASVLLAIQEKNFAYLVAELADPDFVDKRVKDNHGGSFDEFVKEASTKIADNPSGVKELEQFLQSGEWEETGNSASVKLKDFKDRQVFFRKVGDRWFMENKQKAE
jgi:hypothetical protein